MKTRTGIAGIFAGLMAINGNLYSQRLFSGDHEIGLSGSAGMSALLFSPVDGSQPSYSAGYAVGWDIAFMFSERWAFRTGVNMASYHSAYSSDLLETRNLTANPTEIPDGNFYLETGYRGYEEQYEALYLLFPLMAQYRIPVGAIHHFYAAGGVNAGIRTNDACRIRSGDVVTKGYSEYTMQYYEELPGHGFDTYRNVRSADKLDFGFALSGALETGMMWRINNGMALYTGIFLDYGFNDLRKGNPKKESIVYDEYGAHTFNSILHSQNDGSPMTGKVHPLAVGIRLRWSMLFIR